VLLQHMVSSLSVNGRTELHGRLQTVTIPDAVTTQFDLLKMSIVLLDTRRGL